MPFAIEALQSKSKLNNVKSRQFSRTLWPELRQKEDSTIAQAASHNIKSTIRALLARLRGRSLEERPAAEGEPGHREAPRESGLQDAPREPGFQNAPRPSLQQAPATRSNNTNDVDDGFLEINIVKRIRAGNKLLTTATVERHE